MLMGFLHDRECLNQPDEAVKYYRRAAALEDNPDASYSGMYLWAAPLEHRRQWQGDARSLRKIFRRYPGCEGDLHRQIVSQLRDSARQQLAAKDRETTGRPPRLTRKKGRPGKP